MSRSSDCHFSTPVWSDVVASSAPARGGIFQGSPNNKPITTFLAHAAGACICFASIFLIAGCNRPESASRATGPKKPESDSVAQRAPKVYAERMIVGLPDIRVAEQGQPTPPDQIFKHNYRLSQDWFSTRIPVWKAVLASYKGKPNLHYLEVGVFEGQSAMWMLENILTDPTCRLTAIDPFEGNRKDIFLANVAKAGAEAKVTTIVGYSQIELRKIPLESCDIIYVDGSHDADNVLEDAVLSWRLLKPGGLLIFDDYQWEGLSPFLPEEVPAAAINAFYVFYGDHFEVVHNGYQLFLKKK